MPKLKTLTSKDTLVILTFAKAGLGHLRVTYALLEALPKGTRSSIFSTLDTTTTFMHRLTSTNPVLRELAELTQHGLAERIFTSLYTRILRLKANALLPQIEATLNNLKPRPKRVIFVSTHFGLAHQLAALKLKLNEVSKVEASLVVVVTDDSPQRAWSVPGADLTVVPSKLTKLRLNAPNTKVVHYPLSTKLGHELKMAKFLYKFKQASPDSRVKIKVSLPVSGAAVGLGFYESLAISLHKLEPRFTFHITSRDSAYTKSFLERIEKLPQAKVYKYEYDRAVVANYNKIISQNTIAYEVTKPSEQAFKALYSPKQSGGVILLFAHPVGRQEYDNLAYLSRNKLIPSKEDQNLLWTLSRQNKEIPAALLTKARNWRGVRLPRGSGKSALFINWMLNVGVFRQMMGFDKKDKSRGATDIWKLVNDIV